MFVGLKTLNTQILDYCPIGRRRPGRLLETTRWI